MSEPIRVLDHGFVRLCDSMGGDISIVRAARVSYDAAWRAGEDAGSDARLIRYLWKNAHTSPFEAVTLTFEVKAPIFVLRQWHRHRTWCLSGDTMISFELPNRMRKGIRTAKKMQLDDLWRKWQPSVRHARPERQTNALRGRNRIKKMLLRVFDEKQQEFTVGHIGDILFSGEKPIYEITLADGKTLKCSRDHRLLTQGGWRHLQDAVGLVHAGNVVAMSKECYVMTNGYTEAQIPWNKGLSGYKTSRVMTETEKDVIRAARSGEKSNFWRGGVTSDRANIARWTSEQAPKVHERYNYICQDCLIRGGTLHAHHIKSVVTHPELARDFDNLVTLCKSCHQKVHNQSGETRMSRGQTLRPMQSKVVSIRYVGIEPTYDISVEGPHHNFVGNGMIVHNSFNELSGRYRELPEEFYVPDPDSIGVPSKSNKQARDLVENKFARVASHAMQEHGAAAFDLYLRLLGEGIPRELARTVLPLSTYSHMFATVNLLNLFRFMTLRIHEHAQHEIRVYAEAMCDLARYVAPVAVAAWEDAR